GQTCSQYWQIADIGLAIAQALVAEGCDLIISGRSRERLKRAQYALKSRNCRSCPAPLSDLSGAILILPVAAFSRNVSATQFLSELRLGSKHAPTRITAGMLRAASFFPVCRCPRLTSCNGY